MDDFVRIGDEYYIRASSSLADDRTRVLKQGETFAVFDRRGDILPVGAGMGLFHEGTRFLSRLELRVGGERPLLLSSTVKQDNEWMTVDLTNPDLVDRERVAVPRGALHIFRSRFLWQGVYYEQVRVRNYSSAPVAFPLSLALDADFADVFEVRGVRRPARGQKTGPYREGNALVIRYLGLDGVERWTRIHCHPAPRAFPPEVLVWDLALGPGEEGTVQVAVACQVGPLPPPVHGWEAAFRRMAEETGRARSAYCQIFTANEQFNDWLNRSLADLQMLVTETEWGPYPYAGVPWYSAPFGRDGLLTALYTLWLNPDLARGVLTFLAATQAREEDPERDAEPGKVLHEARRGEMANLGEIPFGRYYGTLDATPLFVALAGLYHRHTGDREFLARLWPSVLQALEWMERYGDRDGDGFLEYERRSKRGLVHQSWRDSHEAVFHADGSPAEGPIAPVEVQGYAYLAWTLGAEMAEALGEARRALAFRERAERLRERFDPAFWVEELGLYAMALDGKKRPCRVRCSSVGHLLFTGILTPQRARRVADALLSPAFFSGWGVRTVAEGEARFNPMSYHNGSVWPHDTALIALGLSRYGFREETVRLFTGLFDASIFVDLHRLPELFCGFARRPGEGPTLYPVACLPQAWAAASVFLLLQALLGLSVDGAQARLVLHHPHLPESLPWVRIRGLRVGHGRVDLHLRREGADVSVAILRKEGPVEVMVLK